MHSPLRLSPLLLVLASPAAIGQQVYDHFDDGDRDGPEWNFPEFLEVHFTEANSLHIVDGPPAGVDANMVSTQHFRGDFEIVLDWREFSSSATSFNQNEPNYGLDVQSADGQDWVSITRGLGPFSGNIGSRATIGGNSIDGGSLGTNDPDGLFKITRTGDLLETWYDLGAGWVRQGSFPGGFTSDVRIQSTAYTGDDGSFHAASDFVTFIGTEVFPNLDLRVNGSASKITVSAGTRVQLSVAMTPNEFDGLRGDWFAWAWTPRGLYWLDIHRNWVPSNTPLLGYQGAFRTLPPFTLLDTTGLPVGEYEFFVGVDPIPNGTPDEDDGFRWDVVHLAVQ